MATVVSAIGAVASNTYTSLPSGIFTNGNLYYVKRTDTTPYHVYVSPPAGGTIDGSSANYDVPVGKVALFYNYDGTNYYVLGLSSVV